jgi:hypothetical protein
VCLFFCVLSFAYVFRYTHACTHTCTHTHEAGNKTHGGSFVFSIQPSIFVSCGVISSRFSF